MKKKIILLLLVFGFLTLGCTKKETYNSCEDMIVKAGPFEKNGNISVVYAFNEDYTGTAHLNSLDYNTTWSIVDNTFNIHYSIDDYSFDHTYTLTCDLDNVSYTISDSSGTGEFIKKGTQVIEKLSGTKGDNLKGIWYNDSGVSFALDSDSKSGSGLFQTEDKVFYVLTHYDWVSTNNELTLKNLTSGIETVYTYTLTDDILKMYKDGTLVVTYSHVKDGYTIEEE